MRKKYACKIPGGMRKAESGNERLEQRARGHEHVVIQTSREEREEETKGTLNERADTE